MLRETGTWAASGDVGGHRGDPEAFDAAQVHRVMAFICAGLKGWDCQAPELPWPVRVVSWPESARGEQMRGRAATGGPTCELQMITQRGRASACETARMMYDLALGLVRNHSAHAAYHEQFWVVAGTAAPVIALAAVLVLGPSYDMSTALLGKVVFTLISMATLAELVVLCTSLISLSVGRDVLSPVVAGVLAVGGFVLLFAAAFVTARDVWKKKVTESAKEHAAR